MKRIVSIKVENGIASGMTSDGEVVVRCPEEDFVDECNEYLRRFIEGTLLSDPCPHNLCSFRFELDCNSDKRSS